MNKEIKEKWITALRSGEYKQGTGYLCRAQEKEYCCLGVLCNLAMKEGICKISNYEKIVSCETNMVRYDGNNSFVPSSVQEWAELDNQNPMIYDGIENTTLATHNDNKGRNFNEIADLIEKYL